jgi:glycosyltransferase involved in cell wall biosynthesis
VSVFSPGERDGAAHVEGVDVTHIKCRLDQPFAHIEFQVRALFKLRKDFTGQADIIHFHSEPEGALFASGFAAKSVLSYNNFYFRGGRTKPFYRAYRHLIQAFDVLLPCSEYCRSASAEYWSLPRARLQVSSPGVDIATFQPDSQSGCAERAILGVAGPLILYVGRICHQKGTGTLLAAFERIRAEYPTATLLLVGPFGQFDGHDDVAARGWRKSIATVGAVHLGAVADERLPRLYNAADVFVMPTAELEMFGMAAVEAEACGTPVVASDHGGLRETVPAKCGARFPPGDAAALAEAVLNLLEDEALRKTCGENARAHALRFSWSRVAADLDEIYVASR